MDLDPAAMSTIAAQAPGVAGVVVLVGLFLVYLTRRDKKDRDQQAVMAEVIRENSSAHMENAKAVAVSTSQAARVEAQLIRLTSMQSPSRFDLDPSAGS